MKYGFIPDKVKKYHWKAGSGLASARFGADDINPSGNWTKEADEQDPELAG